MNDPMMLAVWVILLIASFVMGMGFQKLRSGWSLFDETGEVLCRGEASPIPRQLPRISEYPKAKSKSKRKGKKK